jgi:hypothetical protein
MAKSLWLALGILLVAGVVSIVFGTAVPTGPYSTPYFSALSNLAVSTAEAVGCNHLECSANVCITNHNPDQPRACKIVNGNCQSTLCFP